MKDDAYDWVTTWKEGRGENVASMSWDVFQTNFLKRFFPKKIRVSRVKDLLNPRQGSMLVKEYYLKFTQLAKFAPELLPDSRACMSKFVTGVFDLVIKEYRNIIMIRDMDISYLMNHSQ